MYYSACKFKVLTIEYTYSLAEHYVLKFKCLFVDDYARF